MVTLVRLFVDCYACLPDSFIGEVFFWPLQKYGNVFNFRIFFEDQVNISFCFAFLPR